MAIAAWVASIWSSRRLSGVKRLPGWVVWECRTPRRRSPKTTGVVIVATTSGNSGSAYGDAW